MVEGRRRLLQAQSALLGARMVAVAQPDYGLTRGARWSAGSRQVGSGDGVNVGRPAGPMRVCLCIHACISHRIIVRLSSRLRSVAPRRLRSASARCFLPWSHRRPGRRHAPCLPACLRPCTCVGWMDGFHFCTPIDRTSMDGSTIQGGWSRRTPSYAKVFFFREAHHCLLAVMCVVLYMLAISI